MNLPVLFNQRIDGGIPLDSAIESQQFRSHRRSRGRLPVPDPQIESRGLFPRGGQATIIEASPQLHAGASSGATTRRTANPPGGLALQTQSQDWLSV
jgi:hypothetical protein